MEDALSGRGQAFSQYTLATRGFRSDAPQRPGIATAPSPEARASNEQVQAQRVRQVGANMDGATQLRSAASQRPGITPQPTAPAPQAAPAPAQQAAAVRQAPPPAPSPANGYRFSYGGRGGTISAPERVLTGSVADVVPRETEQGSPAPSVAEAGKEIAARFSSRFSVAGAASNQKPPKASEVRATAQAAVRRFDEDGIRRLEQFFIRNGDFEKARQWREFATAANTQAAMTKWVEAMTYWQMNDEDGFLDAMAEVYNAKGYYEDGLTVLREGTSFQRDDAGNVIGATITFRDGDSGDTFRRTINGPRDLIGAAIIGALSPEQVFERGMAEAEAMAAQQANQGMSMDERIKVEASVRALAKEMAGLNGVTPEVYEQARQIVHRQLGLGSGGDVPVLTD